MRLGYFVGLVLGPIAGFSPLSEPPAVPVGLPDSVAIAGHTLHVPAGFTVNVFAQGLSGVRFLALGPGGAVYATQTAARKIVRLTDTDGDGVAESTVTVLSRLTSPSGIAFRGDTLYFAQETRVQRLNPGATMPVDVVTDLPAGGHETRTIVFGPDNYLYVAVGSSCNVCNDLSPRAAVTRYNPDGSNPHPFATGLRNSVGLAFNPATGELWANNNDRDNIGRQGRRNDVAKTDSLPPERLNILKDGKWYGWPQCYLPGKPNPEYAGTDCSGVEPPVITLPAHSAPLGLAFYTGSTFPRAYRGDAFMALHGSWNRSVPTGAKVVRVRIRNNGPVAVEDFVSGWQLADGSRWGRPVAVLVAADGALLVSDDAGGRIWRVSYEH